MFSPLQNNLQLRVEPYFLLRNEQNEQEEGGQKDHRQIKVSVGERFSHARQNDLEKRLHSLPDDSFQTERKIPSLYLSES